MSNNFTYGEKTNLWQKRLSLISRYLWNLRNFGSKDTFDFNTLTRDQRKDFMYRFFGTLHINIDAQRNRKIFLASSYDRNFLNIFLKNKDEYELREANINKFFVPKFYHDRASRNFLKHLKFVKKHEVDLSYNFTKPSTFGRVLYKYHKNNTNSRPNHILNTDDNEFFFSV